MNTLQMQYKLTLAGVEQSHARARYYELRIATGSYKTQVGSVTDGTGRPFTEEELLQHEVATVARHIGHAQDLLDLAKSLLEKFKGQQKQKMWNL